MNYQYKTVNALESELRAVLARYDEPVDEETVRLAARRVFANLPCNECKRIERRMAAINSLQSQAMAQRQFEGFQHQPPGLLDSIFGFWPRSLR